MKKMENYTVKKKAIQYLWIKAEMDMSKAELSLDLLLNNAVGIGDHSTGDFHKNLDEALDILVDATDRLEILKERYPRR
jgi:hypothetical protein|tara:strand:+ start:615 stop:851 length:237 start_codon:yes stop_codon:yes gene_type:complete